MLNSIKKILFDSQQDTNLTTNPVYDRSLEIATCAVFIELAKADENFSNSEKDLLINSMKKCFNLNDDEVQTIFELAELKVENSVSIYEFTKELNQHFNDSQKEDLIKKMWKLIFVDNILNAYEDNLIKKIGQILNLEHKKIIELKLTVKKELNIP